MSYQPTYKVREERRAYRLEGGPVGCLMIHGFMGSPLSSRAMSGYLNQHGVTVYCPLLPGHGHWPDKLYKVPRQAWIDEVEEAYADLKQRSQEMFIMGHSMGCVLGAHLVNKYQEAKGLTMLAPLYDVPDKRIRLVRYVHPVYPWFYPLSMRRLRPIVHQRVKDFEPNVDLDDPAIQERLPEMTRLPTSGLTEMIKMADWGRRMWPQTDVPALILQGGDDFAVSPGNDDNIYALLPNSDKRVEKFPHAGHELMRDFDPAHTRVWPLVYDFIKNRSQETLPQALPLADIQTHN